MLDGPEFHVCSLVDNSIFPVFRTCCFDNYFVGAILRRR
jgi:hypothetical protein